MHNNFYEEMYTECIQSACVLKQQYLNRPVYVDMMAMNNLNSISFIDII